MHFPDEYYPNRLIIKIITSTNKNFTLFVKTQTNVETLQNTVNPAKQLYRQ